jgi:hypothetical protein
MTLCPAPALFVHATVEPVEMLTAFGENPPVVIDTLAVVGVGEVGVLPWPHAIVAASNISAKVSRLQTDITASFSTDQRKAIALADMQKCRGIGAVSLWLAYEKSGRETDGVSHPHAVCWVLGCSGARVLGCWVLGCWGARCPSAVQHRPGHLCT